MNSAKEVKASKSKHCADLYILCGTVEWKVSAAVFSVILGSTKSLNFGGGGNSCFFTTILVAVVLRAPANSS